LVDERLTPTLVLLPGLDGTGLLFRAFVEALSPHVETQVVTYPVDQRLGYAELDALVRAALPTDRPYIVLGPATGQTLAEGPRCWRTGRRVSVRRAFRRNCPFRIFRSNSLFSALAPCR
jgi:hypothetical protein